MKNFFFLFVFATFFVSHTAIAQVEDPDDIIHGNLIANIIATETEGSPYFNIKWLKGRIILRNNTKTNPIPIRYNAANNSVEYKRNGKRFIIKGSKIKGFIILTDKKNIIFKNGYTGGNNGINSESLLRVIYNGSVKLLAHHTAELQGDLATYGTATKKNAFHQNIYYYIITKNGDMTKIELEKDDILRIFKEKKAAIKEFASVNNLKFTNERGVQQILRYYDEKL